MYFKISKMTLVAKNSVTLLLGMDLISTISNPTIFELLKTDINSTKSKYEKPPGSGW